MKLRDLGEFGLIERIERAARRSRAASRIRSPRGLVVGIGDDGAVLRPPAGEDWVVTTDALVEGVHFRWSTQSARCVGRRALVANLSDLAAMGARPLGFVFALAAPPDLEIRTLDGLLAGLLEEADTHGCPLIGGNLSRARQTSVTITAQGSVQRGCALLRSAARPGDRIFVTGTLGGVALEVARAAAGRGRVRGVPIPRLRAGRALARMPGVGACIDISDGLLADLDQVLDRSGCSAELDLASVPRPPRFEAACRRLGVDPIGLATRGGEDYELLFTLRRRTQPGALGPARRSAASGPRGSSGAPGPAVAALSRRLGVAVTEIGKVVRKVVKRDARRRKAAGWRHF
ncbi:MAG: thiamine-phosphate kinase [Myxococcales bacterium]|nr:thiamine-phosphate kinase [Myxococcales bacterium]